MYIKDPLLIAKKFHKWSIQHKNHLYNILLATSVVLLLVLTTYVAYHTSIADSTDADALVSTYLFGSGLMGHTVNLIYNHSFVLMIPLLFIQGHLPYHYTSFMLVNIGLVLLTVVAWVYLLIKLFGRKYEILIIILFAGLLFTSVSLNFNIVYIAIRNIEYPIALWFIFIINRLLSNIKYSRKELVFSFLGALLFCLALAGDNLLEYAILLPIGLVFGWYWIQSTKFTKGMLKALILVLTVDFGALFLKFLLNASKIISLDKNYLPPTKILPYNSLWSSTTIAFRQLISLQGANIFGQIPNIHNLYLFINFFILILSTIGLVLILIKTNQKYRKKSDIADSMNFTITVMSVAFFVLFSVYILSGLVVTTVNGQLVSAGSSRYISFLPFISFIGFIWLLKNYYKDYKNLIYLIVVVLFFGIITSFPSISSTYKLTSQNNQYSRTSLNTIIGVLKKNNVHEIITDYWYGPPIKFWSHNTINFAQEIGCNQPLPFNTRQDWFKPQSNIKSALIVDRDAGYWGCTNQQLVQIYGSPSKEIINPGVTPNTTEDIWIYNYDVRRYLLPFSKTS